MIIDNITSMAEIAMKNSINVALSTILPVEKYEWNKNVDDAPERISKVNTALKDYCESNNLFLSIIIQRWLMIERVKVSLWK